MRLLHLAPADPAASGIARYAARFRGLLEEEGVAVSSPAWGGQQPRDISGIRRYVADVRRAAERVDVVHAELGGECLADFYAAREVLRTAATPLCITLHDPPRAVWAPFAFSSVARSRVLTAAARSLGVPASMRLEQTVIHSAAQAFVLSEGGAAALGRSATVLPFPVNGSPPPTYAEPGNGLTVGFFGHWYGGKGVELLVRAAARLKLEGRPLTLRLWGSPLPSNRHAARYRDQVLAIAGELGLRDSLTAGPLQEDRVAAELRALDVVVLPYERPRRLKQLASVSSAMVEALAAGTPVLTSELNSFSELVRHGDNGLLFRSGDVDRLADCLRQLSADPALRGRLREGAIRTAHALRESNPASLAVARYRELLANQR